MSPIRLRSGQAFALDMTKRVARALHFAPVLCCESKNGGFGRDDTGGMSAALRMTGWAVTIYNFRFTIVDFRFRWDWWAKAHPTIF